MKRLKILSGILVSIFVLLGCSKHQSIKNEKYPQSIVSLSPAASEILFAVGAGPQVSAVSDYTDFPPEAAEVAKVGGFDGKTLSIESILSFKPDFVYLTDGMHNFLIDSLDSYGISYYLSKSDSIADVKQEILDIGELTGHIAESQKVVDNMNEKLSKYDSLKNNKARKPSVYYEVWDTPYITAGKISFINDVIETSGCENIFADIDEAYPIVSDESIIARNPIIILLPATSGLSPDSVKERNGWSEIYAVQNNNIFIIDDNVFTRPGPRIADSVENLYKLINE